MSGRNRIFGYLESHGGRKARSRDLSKHEEWTAAILPADAEAGPLETPVNRRPLWYGAGLIMAALVLLGLRLFDLQVVSGGHNLALADGNLTRTQVISAPRGLIYDRNHVLLAQNQPSYDIVVVRQQLPIGTAARQKEYAALASLVGQDPTALAKTVQGNCPRSLISPCWESPVGQLAIPNITRDQALRFDQDNSSYPGFSLDVNPTRQYNNEDLSPVLGYTGRVSAADLKNHPSYDSTDYIGETGLEAQYESLLHGINGAQQTEVDATGQAVRVLAQQAPVPGDNLVLAIDSALQSRLASDLQNAMNADTTAKPTEAAAVAMDPQTGEILAMVSLPSYDNNLFAKGISQSAFSALVDNKAQPLLNKAIQWAGPVGSIIKPLVASAALQQGTLTTSTTINDDGQVHPNGSAVNLNGAFHDYVNTGFGVENLFKSMAISSNVFFMSVGGGGDGIIGLGVDLLTHYYKLFGLGAKTGIDLPGEVPGVVPTPAWKETTLHQPWYLGDTYNISIGQGDIQITPIQMAVAISAVANGGKVLVPHILDAVTNAVGKVIEQVKPQVVRQGFISPQNIATVQQAMRDAVIFPYGTDCCYVEAEVPVDAAAKTGTAQNGSSEADAWFVTYAPYEDPQLVIVALIPNGGEGGYVTAPAIRQTMIWYFTQGAGKTEGPRHAVNGRGL